MMRLVPFCLLLVPGVLHGFAGHSAKLEALADYTTSSRTTGCRDVANYLAGVGHSEELTLNVENADLKICTVGPDTSTCCSQLTERALHHLAVEITYKTLHSITQPLVTLMQDSSAYYLAKYRTVVEKAENLTSALLTDTYQLDPYHWHDFLHELFLDISASLRGLEYVNLQASVYRFFDNLFPIVFQNILSDPSTTAISSDYRNCLIAARSDLYPRPFGDVPTRLGASLTRALNAAHTCGRSLAVGANVLQLLSQWSLTDNCSHALTKLSSCAICYQIVDARPCLAFCTDVLHSCFVGVTDVDMLWNQFVDELVLLGNSFDLESVMLGVHSNVSESIMHAMEMAHKYYLQLVSRCGHPSPMSQSRNVSVTSSRHVAVRLNTETTPELTAQMSALMTNIATSRGFFRRLPDVLCSDKRFMADKAEICWNGSHIAPYIQKTGKFNADAVDLTKLTAVQTITSKLTNALKVLTGARGKMPADAHKSYHDDGEMQGDAPYYDDVGSGSDRQARHDLDKLWMDYSSGSGNDANEDDDDDDDVNGSKVWQQQQQHISIRPKKKKVPTATLR